MTGVPVNVRRHAVPLVIDAAPGWSVPIVDVRLNHTTLNYGLRVPSANNPCGDAF